MFMLQIEAFDLDLSRHIVYFYMHGQPVYYFKYPITSHCMWDVACTCELCLMDWWAELDEDHETVRERKRK